MFYLYLDLLYTVAGFRMLGFSLYFLRLFHNKAKCHRKEQPGRSSGPVHVALDGPNVSFWNVTYECFFLEFCQNYSAVCIDDFGRNQEVGILSTSWNKAGLQLNKRDGWQKLILNFCIVYLKYWLWLLLLLKLVSNNSWKCLPRQVFSAPKGTRFMARCQIPV